MLLTEKKKGVRQNGQTPSIIGICSYCELDRPVFEQCQTLLHPELTHEIYQWVSARKMLLTHWSYVFLAITHQYDNISILPWGLWHTCRNRASISASSFCTEKSYISPQNISASCLKRLCVTASKSEMISPWNNFETFSLKFSPMNPF